MATDGELMRWGAFTFKLTTAAFQKLSRQDTWRWVTQERFQNDPAEQYVGRGSRVITMEGIIFGAYDPGSGVAGKLSAPVGTHQLDILRYYADQGEPAMLVDGRGNVLGLWVLVGMKEDQEYFLVNGAPQKQAFVVEFRFYGKNDKTGYVSYAAKASTPQAFPGVASTFTPLAQQYNAFTGKVATALQEKGMSPDTATQGAIQTNAFVNANPGTVLPYATQLSEVYAARQGLSGSTLDKALQTTKVIMSGNSYADAGSITASGLTGMGEGLSMLRIEEKAQTVETLAVMAAAPSSVTDRGVFMRKLGEQLGTIPGKEDVLAGHSVPVGSRADANPETRLGTMLSDLQTFQDADPSAFAEVFPPAQYGELYQAIGEPMSSALVTQRGNVRAALQ